MSSYLLSQDEKLEILDYINNYRTQHNSTKLVFDEELTSEAQKHSIIMLKNKELNFETNDEYSKVLYSSWACRNTKMFNIKHGIDECYKESKLYNFQEYTISNSKKCGNFTALIWKDSTKIGIGYAYVNAKCVLCIYISNKGNNPDSYHQNVFPINI